MIMKKYLIFILLFTLVFIVSSCRPGSLDVSNIKNEPQKVVAQSSSFLTNMGDLKAINIAASFLKEIGESTTYQETFIEYHGASDKAVHLSLEDDKALDYIGEYLEIRFYFSEKPEDNPCEKCTTVYIDNKGEIIGYIMSNNFVQDEPTN